MKNERTRVFVFYSLIFLLIAFSFYNFSEICYPLLNSDMAVNILMTPGFSLPGDLYFWGQDRAGSLIPMLAQVLCDIYRFPPALAVSIVHSGILIAGFFAFSTFFKTRLSKILLAAAWFFPAWHFQDHVVLLFGVQMSMLGIGLWALRNSRKPEEVWKQLVWHSAACLFFILSVWVSDLSVLSVLILIVLVAWLNKVQKDEPGKTRLLKLISLILWSIAGTLFIVYAKHKAVRIESYNQHAINSLHDIFYSMKILALTIDKIITFSSENFAESIFAWLVIIGIPYIIIISEKKEDNRPFLVRYRWLLFFAANGIILFLTALTSHWVYLNGVGRRYFAPVFIFAVIAFLLFFEATRSRKQNLRIILSVVIFFFGSLSAVFPFYFPDRQPSRMTLLDELKPLGNIGIIGEYWNAYLSASPDPNHIKATPHDSDYVRNPALVSQVFNQPRLYVIRDGWMKTFPDTLVQFGNILVKRGHEERIAGGNFCRYERLLYQRTFNPGDLSHQGTIEKDSTSLSGWTIRTTKGFDHTKHFIFGPFISLKPGHIMVRYHLKANMNLTVDPAAILDVCGNYGKKILAQRTLRFCDFGAADHYEYFEMLVPIDQAYEGVEFRIFYLGKGQLWFDRIEMTGL